MCTLLGEKGNAGLLVSLIRMNNNKQTSRLYAILAKIICCPLHPTKDVLTSYEFAYIYTLKYV
jgi:hypothetical protein